MTQEEFDRLVALGVIDRVEYLSYQLYMGDYAIELSPEQVRVARAHGLNPRGYVDAVLEDEAALAELLARLSITEQRRP